jgi:hypothetical protein
MLAEGKKPPTDTKSPDIDRDFSYIDGQHCSIFGLKKQDWGP